jgi:hypothetical protein
VSKNVFFLSMHHRLGRSLSWMLREAGYQVFTPDFDFAHKIRGRFENSFPQDLPGTVQVDAYQFGQMKFHSLFLLCHEQECGNWWSMVRSLHPDTPVVHYAGNNWVPYNKLQMKHLLSTDRVLLERAVKEAVGELHSLFFRPALPFTDWHIEFDPARAKLAGLEVSSFVIGLERFWPQAFKEFQELRGLLAPHGITLTNYENLTDQQMRNVRWKSLCCVHLKDQDGWGFAPLEVQAMGIPCLVLNRLAKGRSLGFLIPEEHRKDTVQQMADQILKWKDDREALYRAGGEAQMHLELFLDEDIAVKQLEDFMRDVK